MASLQEHLEQSYDVDVDFEMELAEHPEGHPELQETQRFIVDDESKAEWAVRKLARIEAQIDTDTALANAEIEKVASWLDGRTTVAYRQIEFFRSLLREYHEMELARDPKRKTISLPSGKLRARKAAPRWVVDVPDAFVEWAEKHLPEAVRVRKEPARSEIRKLLDVSDVACTTEDGQPAFYAAVPDTGEIVPGITVVPVPGGLSFNVDTGGNDE